MSSSIVVKTAILLAVFGVAACASDGGVATGLGESSSEVSSEIENNSTQSLPQASYRLIFNASWGQTTHPTNFPSGPHFSGLVGAVHNEQSVFWEPGQIATAGIARMAETGSKTLLLDEIRSVIDEGRALSEISGAGIGVSPGSASIEFTVTRDNPQVSVVSMLAPSPDWFVGVHGLSMLSDEGTFIESSTVDLILYDSGTDSGVRYASANQDTQPQGTIARVTSDSADTNFVNGLPTVGQFVFEKL